jgi:hypothetical protein
MAALSLGLIFCGSSNEDISEAIVYTLMELTVELNVSMTRFLSVGLALVFLGQ